MKTPPSSLKKDNINKDSFKYAKELDLNEVLAEMYNLYDGSNHRHLKQLIKQLIKCFKKEIEVKAISKEDLEWLRGCTASFNYARKLTNNDYDAISLVRLINQVKEHGLTYTTAFTDEQDLNI